MTNPNLVNTSQVYMRSNIQIPISSITDVVEVPADSNMIIKIDELLVCNVGSINSSVDVFITRSATTYAIAKNVSVSIASKLNIIDRDFPIYLLEGDKLQISGDPGLEAVCSYTIISDTNITLPSRPTINTPDPTEFRYVRWVITGSKSTSTIIQVAEFVLQSGGSDITMSGATATNPDGDNPAGEEPSDAIDGSTATKWLDFNFGTNGQSILLLDFGAGNEVSFDGYRWATANDATERDPDDWTVEVSNDNTNWVVVDTVTNASVTDTRLTYVGPYSF